MLRANHTFPCFAKDLVIKLTDVISLSSPGVFFRTGEQEELVTSGITDYSSSSDKSKFGIG